MLPRVDPLRPVLTRNVPRGREWVYELKLDGFRGTLYIEDGRGKFYSKTKRSMPRFNDLAAHIVRALNVRDAILDGEILVIGERGPQFDALMKNAARPDYAAFDLLWLDGRDLRPLPFWRRKRMLRRVTAGSPVGYVDHVNDARLYESVVAMDLEGIIAKRRSDPYAENTEWLKIKHAGYSQNEGRWELFERKGKTGAADE
jgi:bifunctional non-homologous end joining protein LigD